MKGIHVSFMSIGPLPMCFALQAYVNKAPPVLIHSITITQSASLIPPQILNNTYDFSYNKNHIIVLDYAIEYYWL